MRKMFLCTTVLAFHLLSFVGLSAEAKTKTEIIPQNHPPSIMEQAFLRNLGSQTILDIMHRHGDNQLFWFERIEKITAENDDTYDVSLRVIGFEGAHNPPFKLIRITIRIPGKSANYDVKSYSHRIISDKEFVQLTKYGKD